MLDSNQMLGSSNADILDFLYFFSDDRCIRSLNSKEIRICLQAVEGALQRMGESRNPDE